MLRALVPRSARNWLRDPRRTFQWAIDHARFAFGRIEPVEIRPGWILRAHPLAARCAYMPLVTDPEQCVELDTFLVRCRPGMRLLDVGAHFGVFSFAALHYGGPGARAVAVEPSSSATKMLALQAELNSCSDRLAVIEACAGAVEGERGMLDTGIIGAGYFVAADSNRRSGDLSRVRAVVVDALCGELAFHPTHLKIDVEGEELDVLRGASALLAGQAPPTIFLELHNAILREKGREPGEVLEWLGRAGYAVEDVLTGPVTTATLTRAVSRLVASRTTH